LLIPLTTPLDIFSLYEFFFKLLASVLLSIKPTSTSELGIFDSLFTCKFPFFVPRLFSFFSFITSFCIFLVILFCSLFLYFFSFIFFFTFFLFYFIHFLTFFSFISFLVPPGLYSFSTASIHMDTNKQIGSCFVCQISSILK